MASCTVIETTGQQSVGMGQIKFGKGPVQFHSVLGSCVGVGLYHARSKVGALAHVVLPTSTGDSTAPGKFADQAIPHMLDHFTRNGIPQSGLVAKIVGGACMFGANGPMQIGETNIEAVQKLLKDAGIPVIASDLGGSNGRRIDFSCEDGSLTVATVGNPTKVY